MYINNDDTLLQSECSLSHCNNNLQKKSLINKKKSTWTRKEDKYLIELRDTHKISTWKEISTHFNNKNESQCCYRYKIIKNQKKSKWTKDDDQKLVYLCKIHGENFDKILKFFPKKTLNDITIRYYNKVKHYLITFSFEEDIIIYNIFKSFVNKKINFDLNDLIKIKSKGPDALNKRAELLVKLKNEFIYDISILDFEKLLKYFKLNNTKSLSDNKFIEIDNNISVNNISINKNICQNMDESLHNNYNINNLNNFTSSCFNEYENGISNKMPNKIFKVYLDKKEKCSFNKEQINNNNNNNNKSSSLNKSIYLSNNNSKDIDSKKYYNNNSENIDEVNKIHHSMCQSNNELDNLDNINFYNNFKSSKEIPRTCNNQSSKYSLCRVINTNALSLLDTYCSENIDYNNNSNIFHETNNNYIDKLNGFKLECNSQNDFLFNLDSPTIENIKLDNIFNNNIDLDCNNNYNDTINFNFNVFNSLNNNNVDNSSKNINKLLDIKKTNYDINQNDIRSKQKNYSCKTIKFFNNIYNVSSNNFNTDNKNNILCNISKMYNNI